MFVPAIETGTRRQVLRMGIPDSDIVKAIFQMLPGFISAWIFYGLTAHARPTPFERVVQAFIFTMFSEAIVIILSKCLLMAGPWLSFGVWTSDIAFVWKVFVSIVLGLTFACLANTNKLHQHLPDWITKRTSYPSEWFSAFSRHKLWVYLNLKGDRRIFGWAEEWPDESGKGHFLLATPEWILDDNTRVPLVGLERILVPAGDVEIVEFEKPIDNVMKLHSQIEATAKIMIDHNSTPVTITKEESQNDATLKT